MLRRALALSTALLAVPLAARADNPIGYHLLTQQEAAGLPQNHGGLGLAVQRGSIINDTSGTTFDVIRVSQVRPGSPAARGGLKPGDQVIAVDGRVFPSLQVFAAYIGSIEPGAQVQVDYIPAGGGPGQAQRVALGVAPRPGQPTPPPPPAGMSTGTKVAIGVGAAALLGCYEMGCFTHHNVSAPAQPAPQMPPPNQPSYQPQ